jgi:2-polyprenyl-6-methoxyphenol hydroxylase-like FAD-dependent oxidoreductase
MVKSVLISGAGIAGPTLAHWLLCRGFKPTLIEVAPKFREGGYMIDFWGVGFDVAEKMGLLPRLREVGYRMDKMKFVDENGRTRSEFGGDAFRQSLGDRFISLLRGDLAKTIIATIAGKVEVIFGESIRSVREDSAGVEVTFQDSPTRRFDLLAGCDGLHSIVRKLVFGRESDFEKYLGYYAASFLTNDYPHREEKTYLSYAAPGRQISRYALRDGRTAFLFVFEREQPLREHPHHLDPRGIVREAFAQDEWIELPEIVNRLEKCDEIYFDSVTQIRLPSWSRGRSVLVGDAGYCPSLLAGEGSGFAMAGAFILAGELQVANGDLEKAFRMYEQRFRGFIDRKQRAAQMLASSFAPKTRFGLFFRDLVLQAAAFPFVRTWMMRRFVSDQFDVPVYPD